MQYIIKRDKYTNTRDGNSHFLNLYCSNCKQHLALYQKDGQGSLLRLYLDRIFAPKELSDWQFKGIEKNDIPSLKCLKCGQHIGSPMIYELEKRLAIRLNKGSFIKEKGDGTYPPSKKSN